MATIFQMPNRPFWFYQIVGVDGKRLPRVSTKTSSKRLAKNMAEDAEAGSGVDRWSLDAFSPIPTNGQYDMIVPICREFMA